MDIVDPRVRNIGCEGVKMEKVWDFTVLTDPSGEVQIMSMPDLPYNALPANGKETLAFSLARAAANIYRELAEVHGKTELRRRAEVIEKLTTEAMTFPPFSEPRKKG
mgnify:CR=1 FL=1